MIGKVKNELSIEEFQRVRNTFLGPIMKLALRDSMMMSGKMEETKEENKEEDKELEYDWGDVENGHTPSDLLYLLIHIEAIEENKDEKFCLAMLILIESLVIPRYIGYHFPKKVLKIAQNVETLISYPWGRDSYMILLNSVKKIVPTQLGKTKYDIHGFPLSLKRFHTNQVVTIEGYRDLKVVCVLPSIQGDPEDTLFLEDNLDKVLDNLVDIVTNGYKLKIEDCENETIDVMEAMDQKAQQSHRFGVAARSGPSNVGAGPSNAGARPSNAGAETSDKSLRQSWTTSTIWFKMD
ncbi:hypothetical protein EUTSA_v10022492mg [Eutrema salsugineum]|uniref:DUF1985 domain-containing protein n=1 Tax=Eutrema salsugineum TaxID=72664 RepID=V4KLQ9_EUTSA|nr:hypothetical protein EUTSA_v10022492mg [Eutrema salsugineum]